MTAVVILPVPIFVAASWLDRHSQIAPREPKTNGRWPLSQPIPSEDARRALAEARRAIALQRERRLMRELERAP
jgi:hypothetical protein